MEEEKVKKEEAKKSPETKAWQIALLIGIGAGVCSFLVDFVVRGFEDMGRSNLFSPLILAIVVGLVAYFGFRYFKKG